VKQEAAMEVMEDTAAMEVIEDMEAMEDIAVGGYPGRY
jgi:hypothetical protein